MTTIALTGGAGLIGKTLRKYLPERVSALRLLDVADPRPLAARESWHKTNITSIDALTEAFTGADGIIHMAALSSEHDIDGILAVNVLGTYNVYEAARRAGVERVVFGSSNHATGFYPRTTKLTPGVPMRPDSRYGLSKCWGELTAGLFFDKHGIETLSIRIGNAFARPMDPRGMSIWISPVDLTQLVMIGLEHPGITATTVYATSRNDNPWWDDSVARALGFMPRDNTADFADAQSYQPEKSSLPHVTTFFQGGSFCGGEHDGKLRLRPDDRALAEAGHGNASHPYVKT